MGWVGGGGGGCGLGYLASPVDVQLITPLHEAMCSEGFILMKQKSMIFVPIQFGYCAVFVISA